MMRDLHFKLGAVLMMAWLAVGCSPANMTPVQFSDAPSPNNPQQVPEMKETFKQGEQPAPVDILVITDNSRSMAQEQERMAERTQNFLDEINTLDWQMGFTTTDVSSGKYGMKGSLLPLDGGSGSVLKKGDSFAKEIFAETVTRGETLTCINADECPSGDEQPMMATLMALQKKLTNNSGFFRANADFMVVIITDEDEKSDGGGAVKAAALASSVRALLTADQKFIVSGIIIKPGDSDCLDEQQPDGNYGSTIASLVKLTGGFTGSVCAEDYAEQLQAMGKLVRKAADSFQLSKTPKDGTLKLTFSPEQPNTEWKLVGKKVVYTKNPPAIGTAVSASYTSAE